MLTDLTITVKDDSAAPVDVTLELLLSSRARLEILIHFDWPIILTAGCRDCSATYSIYKIFNKKMIL